MNLNFLKTSPPAGVSWNPVKVIYLGGEGYELRRFDAEARIEVVRGGFHTVFRNKFRIPVDALLGSWCDKAVVTDIQVVMPGVTLSMATMYPETFPRHYVRGQVIGLEARAEEGDTGDVE